MSDEQEEPLDDESNPSVRFGNSYVLKESPPTTSRSLTKVGMQVALLGDEWEWVNHYARKMGMGVQDTLSLAFLWGLTHLAFAKPEMLIRMLIDRQRRLETALGNGGEGGEDSTPSDLPF